MKSILKLLPLLAFFFIEQAKAEQALFIVIIPSYNNEKWCEKNLLSALDQEYDNYFVVYIDDCSTDRTGEIIAHVAQNHAHSDKLKIITNKYRRGALANLCDEILTCPNKAVIVTLDGDDWFAHNHVLSRLNEIYSDSNVWMTYGSYLSWPQNTRDPWIHELPRSVIDNNSYRSYQWTTTHLRTFYAGLFKCIKTEDLMYENNFFQMTWDLAFMLPMLEMAGRHSRYVHDISYIYNRVNPLGDRNSNRTMQENLERIIRNRQAYKPIPYLFSN